MAAHSKKLQIIPCIRLNAGRTFAFGPGKADLLEHIEATGSIREAAKTMDISYMRAWQIVKSLENAFAEPLVIKTRGGQTKGGAALSETGREVLRLYRQIQTAASAACQNPARDIELLLKA